MAKKTPLYKERFNLIKKYVDFKLTKNPTNYEKRRIKQFADIISVLNNKGVAIYRPKSSKNLKIAQKTAHGAAHKHLKVAFVPVPRGDKPKISIKNGKLNISSKYYSSQDILISRHDLITREHEAIIDAMKIAAGTNSAGELDNKDGLISFTVLNGHGTSLISPTVKNEISAKLMFDDLKEKYGINNKHHYFGDWLTGIRATKFKNQLSEDEYSKIESPQFKKKRKPKISKRELKKGRK